MVKLQVVRTWHQDWMPIKCMGIYRQNHWSSINMHRRNFSIVFIVLEDVLLHFCHSVNEIFALLDVIQCWLLVTDVSGQPICPIKGQAVQEERLLAPWRRGWLFWNVSKLSTNQCCVSSQKSKDLRWFVNLQKHRRLQQIDPDKNGTTILQDGG